MTAPTPPLVVLGMPGLFSLHALRDLIAQRLPEVVVVPAPPQTASYVVAPRSQLIVQSDSLQAWASQCQVPVLHMAQWQDIMPFLRSDMLMVVACFPWRVPASIRAMVRRAINVHPSLLPALRGPDPLFYVARGDAPSGVTIHEMTDVFDAGDILWQQPLALPDVLSEQEFIVAHAQHGAAGLAQLLAAPQVPAWPAVPQTPHGASRARAPHAFAYTLHDTWSMARVRRFVAGTNLRQHPYFVPSAQMWVTHLDTGGIPIPCRDGVLYGKASTE